MNRIIEALREGAVSHLIQGDASTGLIPAGGSAAIAVNITVNKLLLKSVEVTCTKNTEFYVEFFEDSTHTNSRYNSGIVTSENYDVLDLPYVDQEGATNMYFLIHNTSDVEAEYSIEVRGIEMK